MRKLVITILFSFCAFVQAMVSFAQLKAIPITARFEAFNNKNGLSQGYVSCITQDKAGFMWFATPDGLNKYDGYHVTVYHQDPEDPYSISDNAVLQVAEDEQGNFWVGTKSKGLMLFDRKKERFYHVPLPFDSNSLGNPILLLQCRGNELLIRHADDYCIYNIKDFSLAALLAQPKKTLPMLFSFKTAMQSPIFNHIKKEHQPDYNWTWWMPDRSIWRIYFDSIYILRPGKSFATYTTSVLSTREAGIDDTKIAFLFPGLDAQTCIFVCSNKIVVYDWQQKRIGRQLNFSDDKQPFENYWFNKPFQLPDGTIFFYTPEGYCSLDPHNYLLRKYSGINVGGFGGPSQFTDRDGTIWIGTGGYGIYTYNTRQERFNTLAEEVTGFAEDRQYNMNISFKQTGAAVFSLPFKEKLPFVPKKVWPASWAEAHLFCIDNKGVKWFYTFEKGTHNYYIGRYDPAKNRVESHNEMYYPDAIPGGLLLFFTDKNNDPWILYYCYDNTRKLVHYNGESLAIKEVLVLPVPKDLNSLASFINSVWQDDAHDAFWMASQQGLLRLDKKTKSWKQYKNNPKDPASLSSDDLLSICPDPVDANKYLWVGTSGRGFNRFEIATGKCKRYSDKDGLANNVVYGILSDEAGNLWISTNQGLSCFNIQQERFRNYTDADGLPGNEFNRAQWIKTKSGLMFFGGVNGLTWFDPANVLKEKSTENNIVITGFALANKPVDFKKDSSFLKSSIGYSSAVIIPYNSNVFSIEFSLLQYSPPDKKQYRYKLEGFDKDWQDNGSRNSVTYTNLDPGHYVFHVKGRSSNGEWNKTGATLNITITPPWNQTWWFDILLVVLVSSSLYAFYRYRLHQSVKVANMRNIIASDLHDEIGSTISSITVYSEIIEQKIQDESLQQIARRISDSSRNILLAMSDIVWSINPKNDRFDNILIRMKSFANEVLDVQDKQLHFMADEQLNYLKMEMNNRKNFYLIFKEALTNVSKYANANNVWINIQLVQKQIHFSIKDDGTGFDMNAYREGNGLSNMERRSKDLGGNISIQSQPGKGTEITLIFPA